MLNVSLAKGDESYITVREALDLIRQEVHIPQGMPVLIKPNLVWPTVELCATPVEAVRATMDFLQEQGVKKFTIGEGTALESGDTMGAFERYGYFSLREQYDVEFRDLNRDESVMFEALDDNLTPANIRLAKSCFDSYLVSVVRMKTHDQVVATLSIKNVAIGSILNPDRHDLAWHEPQPGTFSHEPPSLNLSIARLNQTLPPSLAVIDGVVGMEGNGPVDGTPVSSGVALASTDSLAADLVGTGLMGFDWRTIGYLWYLTQLRGLSREDVQVLGEDPAKCITKYRAHDRMPWQLGWWVEDWKRYLGGHYLRSESEAPAS